MGQAGGNEGLGGAGSSGMVVVSQMEELQGLALWGHGKDLVGLQRTVRIERHLSKLGSQTFSSSYGGLWRG